MRESQRMQGGYRCRVPRQLLPIFETRTYTSNEIGRNNRYVSTQTYRNVMLYGTLKTFHQLCKDGMYHRLEWGQVRAEKFAHAVGKMGFAEYAQHLDPRCARMSLIGAIRFMHRDYILALGHYLIDPSSAMFAAMEFGDPEHLDFVGNRFGIIVHEWEMAIGSPILRKKWEHVAWILNKMCKENRYCPHMALSDLTGEERGLLRSLLTEETRAWMRGSDSIFQLIADDGREDRMLMATQLLGARLRRVEQARDSAQ